MTSKLGENRVRRGQAAACSLGLAWRIREPDEQRCEDESDSRRGRLGADRPPQTWGDGCRTPSPQEVQETERGHRDEGRRLRDDDQSVGSPDEIGRVAQLQGRVDQPRAREE